MAGDELDTVMAAMGTLPANAGQVTDSELAARMERLVRLRAMVDAALVEQLAAFDARAAANYDGQTSTQAWLRARLRMGGQVGDLVRVARHLSDLPQVAKAFAAGEVSLEHAALVAKLAGAVGAAPLFGYEHILLELARTAPPAKLRVACEHLRQLLDPDTHEDDAARQRRHRYLAAGRTIDGMVHVQGLLDAASGDVVLTALQAAMPAPAEHEERTPAQRRADALSDICAGWLASGDAPTNGGIRPQVQVTVSLQTLQSGPRPAAGNGPPMLGDVPVLADGQPVPAGEARRLACDAGIIPVVLDSRSEPLDVGRQARLAPVGLRRALNLRDGGCRFAGCDRPAAWCDGRHIRRWADGVDTSLDNMTLLCAYHHTLVHEGWQLIGDPNETLELRRGMAPGSA